MKIAVLSITEKGGALAERIAEVLSQRHAVTRHAYKVTFEKISDLMRTSFPLYDAWICICACGIAVRAIAPYIESKQTDPAVVVMDEEGKFAIPVLSGHVGGANALAKRLSEMTGAQAVVTTATDVGGRFSPDSFAAANELIITDFKAAKEIAAAVLRGEKIGITSDYPLRILPEELQPLQSTEEICRTGMYIGTDETVQPYEITLQLIPKNIVLGIGCKRGTSADRISLQADAALRGAGIIRERICAVATIDRKADEAGLQEYCERLDVPLLTYTADQLMTAGSCSGQTEFASSAFVRETVGVDNVCERSAVLCSGGRLILHKTAANGVTVAAAERPVIIDGEKELLIW